MRVSERAGDRVIFSVPLVVKGVQSLVLVAFVIALSDCIRFSVLLNNDYWFAVRAFYYAFPNNCFHCLLQMLFGLSSGIALILSNNACLSVRVSWPCVSRITRSFRRGLYVLWLYAL